MIYMAWTPFGTAFADSSGAPAGEGLNEPFGVATDAAGNLYVADRANNRICKLTPAGVLTTLVGTPTTVEIGTVALVRLDRPDGLAVDGVGNVYVADSNNNCIRKVTPAGVTTTLAGLAGADAGGRDGSGSAARFNQPRGIAVDERGNAYVADSGNSCIRKVTPTGVVTTLAGNLNAWPGGGIDGVGSAASFMSPVGIALDRQGDIYVADTSEHCIRKVTANGVVTTLAGDASQAPGSVDGIGKAARFAFPSGIAVDRTGIVYVADSANGCIRKVTPTGLVSTLAGDLTAFSPGDTDGAGASARFNRPSGITLKGDGGLYVADTNNNRIRTVTAAGVVTTVAFPGHSHAPIPLDFGPMVPKVDAP